ncbi:hypothetical protein PHLGIDRAFT_164200 [Phlebiopsis gigantea 11061_1 CR5-6]|uniref:Uncharacterized protein n=1 Tax=Phlebiopsis gigantea (strain 11061_1 CR5-6) TaxID=745531 RepID=A0A0C3NJS5_PHLG1|nr:hypothetical protein PHLGIDRAFT_164200 [Phlebiopsis gigantea 11061_1 CR5-6]
MTVQLSLTFTEDPQSSIHTAFSQASTSCILPLRNDNVTGILDPPEALGGAVVGCGDGTFYLFHAAKPSAKEPPANDERTAKLRSSKAASSSRSSASPAPHRSRRGHHSSRSLSPASVKSPTPFSPFQVTKSTVVSSVSAEQVEAPKNYVDYDDEPEKLKGMLRNKGGVKDRTMADAFTLGGEKVKPRGPDKCVEGGPIADAIETTISKTNLRISTSTARSSTSSITSISTPSSPSRTPTLRLADAPDFSPWALISHTIPSQKVPTGPISSLRAIPGCPIIVALFRSGMIGIYSTEDGTCVRTAAAEDSSLLSSPRSKARSKLPMIWHWKHLHVAQISQVSTTAYRSLNGQGSYREYSPISS